MKMTKSRFTLVILMVFILMLGTILSACSQNQPENQSSNDNNKSSNDGKADTPAEKPKERPKITVGVFDPGVVPNEEGTLADNRWVDWINENSPVEIEVITVPQSEQDPKYNTLFAAGDAPDLVFTTGDRISGWVDQKLLMPLDDLIKNHSTVYKALLDKYPQARKVAKFRDGKMYGLVRFFGMEVNHAMYIRNDWLKNLDLDIPETTEELFEVAKAFTENDPDGNGKDDTLGIALSRISDHNMKNMFGNRTWRVEDAMIAKDWEALRLEYQFKKDLYDAGFVDKDFLTDNKGTNADQDFLQGKLGIWGAPGGNYQSLNYYMAFKENNPDGTYIPMPLPESEEGKFSALIAPPLGIQAGINARAKNPEAVMKFIDFMASKETGLTLRFGFRGEHWEVGEDGCPETLDSEKYNMEVTYNKPLWIMLSPEIEYGQCGKFVDSLNPDDPIDKGFIDIYNLAYDAYITKERPYPGVTHDRYLPSLTKELKMIEDTTGETIQDLLHKSVVSGSAYTVDQAIEETKNIWYKAGGQKVEDAINEWYQENKDTAFLRDDMYDFLEIQENVDFKVE